MAIDSNGKVYENRTLQFYGYAYGDNNVSLTATINGNTVFSGEVPTINSPLPIPPIDSTNAVVLFSLPDSPLFPTNQAKSYTVSITVSGGYGAIFTGICSNYAARRPRPGSLTDQPVAVLANSSIEGTTLTIGSIISGSVAIGQLVSLSNQHSPLLDLNEITAGSGLKWTVKTSQTISDTNMSTYGVDMIQGTATDFVDFNYKSRISDVIIDGVAQSIISPFTQYGPRIVLSGSTFAYNLTVPQDICV